MHIVEKIAAQSTMRLYDRAVEAEVVVVIRNFFVDRRVMNGEWNERNLRPHRLFRGEQAPVEVIEGSGGDLVVVGADELNPRIVKCELGVAIVGKDDADSDEAVGDIGKAEEVALFDVVAWLRCHRNMLVGMSVEGGVLVRGLDGRSFAGFVRSEGGYRKEAGCSY